MLLPLKTISVKSKMFQILPKNVDINIAKFLYTNRLVFAFRKYETGKDINSFAKLAMRYI